MKDSVDRFANRESIKRLRMQLKRTTDDAQRNTLFALLAEEEARAAQLANETEAEGRAKQGR